MLEWPARGVRFRQMVVDELRSVKVEERVDDERSRIFREELPMSAGLAEACRRREADEQDCLTTVLQAEHAARRVPANQLRHPRANGSCLGKERTDLRAEVFVEEHVAILQPRQACERLLVIVRHGLLLVLRLEADAVNAELRPGGAEE